ncbi:MAG: hypothetical protein AAF727_15585 [Pseudomonadota bacterium]
MKAVVHIGMPKTGSTTIQRWLTENEAALAKQGYALARHSMADPAQSGFHEVSIGLRTAAGMSLDPKKFMAQKTGITSYEDQQAYAQRYEAHLTALIAQSQAHTLVFSAGDISQIGRMGDPSEATAQVQAADRWLRQFFDDIRYILYLRRPEDWFTSAYVQRLKNGYALDFETYYENVRRFGDWSKLALAWREGVGPDRLVMRIMERDVLHNGDLTEDFARILGLDATQCASTTMRNQAPSAAAVTFLQSINRRCADDPEFAKARADLVHDLRNFLRANTDHGPKFQLPADVVEKIRSDFAQSNEVLRQTFFPELAEIFPARAQAAPHPDAATKIADDMAVLAVEFAHWGLSKHRNLTGDGQSGAVSEAKPTDPGQLPVDVEQAWDNDGDILVTTGNRSSHSAILFQPEGRT